MIARCEPKLMADGNVNGAHVANLIGYSTEPPTHLLKKWPIVIIIHTLKLFHLHEQFIEAEEADTLRSAAIGKRVLLELADEIDEAEPDRIQLHLAGLVSGPSTRFFRQNEITSHRITSPPWSMQPARTSRRNMAAVCRTLWPIGRGRAV